MHYNELLAYAQQHKTQLLSSREQQSLFLDEIIKAIKPIHANHIDIKKNISVINRFVEKIQHSTLTEKNFEALLEQIKIIHSKGLILSKQDNAQAWLIDKMQVSGYQLTGFGQCLGIVYMATQAFFLENMSPFKQRLNLIYHLPTDYFENGFENPKKQIEAFIKNNELRSAAKAQEQLNDIKAFFEGIALYSIANKHAEWFGISDQSQMPKQLPLERSMSHILPDSLSDPQDNKPAYIRSFSETYTLGDVENLLITLHSTLSDENFTLHFKSPFHIAALFYDAKRKKWFHVQPDNLPGEEIHTLDLLAPIIFSDFSVGAEQQEFHIDLYAQEKNISSVKMKLDTLQSNDVWAQRYLANPFKKDFSFQIRAIIDVIDHQQFEWFETQLKELHDEQIYKVLIGLHNYKKSFGFLNTYPENMLDPLINICLQNISDSFKLLYAVSISDEELCTTLIQNGAQPTFHALKKINDNEWLHYNRYVNEPIRELVIQHYPIHTDADIYCARSQNAVLTH